MAQYNSKPAATVNAFMKEYLPETAGCTYADFPMQHARWLQPKETTTTPDGGDMPCFIKTGNELPAQGSKQGYVWGPGPLGFGYYHLLTKSAHVTLYTRILNRRVFLGPNVGGGGCCGCFGEMDPRAQMPKGVKADDIDDLRRLFHARSVASIPNDGVAAQDALGEARATAQAHYHFDQNIQLGMHVAGAAMVR